METVIEDCDYARIDEVLDSEFIDNTTPPRPPALPKSFSLSSSHSSSLSGSPARVRSESLFTRSHNPRPVSLLEETQAERLRDIPHKVDNTRGHALLSIKFAESGISKEYCILFEKIQFIFIECRPILEFGTKLLGSVIFLGLLVCLQ